MRYATLATPGFCHKTVENSLYIELMSEDIPDHDGPCHRPCMLHRTLVFPLGRVGPRPEAPRYAHAFRSHSPGYGGFRGRRGRPRRPAGEHHEHSGACNRPCDARRCFANFLSGLRKPPKGAHHRHQRSSAEGGCTALLQTPTCAARPWAQPQNL